MANLGKVVGVAAIASALMFGHARADVLNLTSSGGGATLIDFSGVESFTDQLNPGSQNYGVFSINGITTNGTSTFAAGQGGTYLVGVFDGITVGSASGAAPNLNVANTGGTFQIWQVTGAQLAAAGTTIGALFAQGSGGYTLGGCAVGGLCYNGITNSGGIDFLNFHLTPGADVVNPADTLFATVTSTNFPVTGSANGYGVITGGAAQDQFLTGGYTTANGTSADLTFADEFCTSPQQGQTGAGRCLSQIGDWSQQFFDPATANVVPEPFTLSLMGIGLIGIGAVRRRRRQ